MPKAGMTLPLMLWEAEQKHTMGLDLHHALDAESDATLQKELHKYIVRSWKKLAHLGKEVHIQGVAKAHH